MLLTRALNIGHIGLLERILSMSTTDARKLSPAALEDLRHRVVRAVVEQGLKVAEATRTFGVGRTALHSWLKAHRLGGEAALRLKKRGRKPEPRLKGHQAATIVRLITDRCPDQLKLPFALWTREAVGELIEQRCGRLAGCSSDGVSRRKSLCGGPTNATLSP